VGRISVVGPPGSAHGDGDSAGGGAVPETDRPVWAGRCPPHTYQVRAVDIHGNTHFESVTFACAS